MKTIYKWTVGISGEQVVAMPAGAEILCVQMQGSHPQVWALCGTNLASNLRTIAIYGTGNPVPDNPGRHIGTFQMDGGALVWHAFEPERV